MLWGTRCAGGPRYWEAAGWCCGPRGRAGQGRGLGKSERDKGDDAEVRSTQKEKKKPDGEMEADTSPGPAFY